MLFPFLQVIIESQYRRACLCAYVKLQPLLDGLPAFRRIVPYSAHMNLTHSPNNGLLYVSFNQDYSCFAVGTENGFFICDCDPVRERFRREFDDKGIGVVEMLFRCNILSLVGGGKNPYNPVNKVMIWDDFRAACIAELEFRSSKDIFLVRGVRLRRDRIFVILDKKVFVYNFADLKLLDEIETYENPTGICAVCSAKDNGVMACLGKNVGEVAINYSNSLKSITITAHNNAISQMALSIDGTKLATTSTQGTLVRIFDTATGEKLQEFRRGAQAAEIQCLAFNKDGSALVLSSNKGTIHVYNCNSNAENRQSSLSFMSGVVPILGSTWSWKQFSVPETQSICAFCNENDDGNGVPNIIVLGSSGRYYKYSFSENSNECKKEKEDYFYKPKQ